MNVRDLLGCSARVLAGEMYTTFDSVDETPHMGGLKWSTRRDLENGIGWDCPRGLCGEQGGHLFVKCPSDKVEISNTGFQLTNHISFSSSQRNIMF